MKRGEKKSLTTSLNSPRLDSKESQGIWHQKHYSASKRQKEDRKAYCYEEDAKLEKPAWGTLNQRFPFLLTNNTKLACWRENACIVLLWVNINGGNGIVIYKDHWTWKDTQLPLWNKGQGLKVCWNSTIMMGTRISRIENYHNWWHGSPSDGRMPRCCVYPELKIGLASTESSWVFPKMSPNNCSSSIHLVRTKNKDMLVLGATRIGPLMMGWRLPCWGPK